MDLQIKDKKIPLKFSFALILMLAKLWNEKYIENVIARLAVGVDENGKPIEGKTPVQLFYDVVDVVKCAAKIAGNEIDASDDELLDVVFADFSIVEGVLKNLASALPNQNQNNKTDPESRKKK